MNGVLIGVDREVVELVDTWYNGIGWTYAVKELSQMSHTHNRFMCITDNQNTLAGSNPAFSTKTSNREYGKQ